jgi:hypothetical protein
VPSSRSPYFFNVTGTDGEGLQIGPLGPTAISLLTSMRVTAVSGCVNASFESSYTFAGGYVWGVQYVPTGDSPLALPADGGADTFLFLDQMNTNDAISTWTPNTDPTAYIMTWDLHQDWHGQLLIDSTVDFYITVGVPESGIGLTYIINGVLDLLHT